MEFNHSLTTQHNESLNRSISALAPKDRAYNSSISLAGRIAIVVCQTNLGSEQFLQRLCSKIGLRYDKGMFGWGQRSNDRTKGKKESQRDEWTKMRR